MAVAPDGEAAGTIALRDEVDRLRRELRDNA
jgi:hypothetical protein